MDDGIESTQVVPRETQFTTGRHAQNPTQVYSCNRLVLCQALEKESSTATAGFVDTPRVDIMRSCINFLFV